MAVARQRPLSVSSSAGLGDGFTEADLAAADQLVQLSASGGGDEAASPSSSTLSARSVNNTEAATAREDDDDEDGVAWLDRRARKRYRLVLELYDATAPVERAGGGGKRRIE